MKQYLGAFLLALIALVPLSITHAETVLRAAQEVTIEHDQSIDGDFYGAAGPFGRVTVSGPIQEDAVLLGGTAIVNSAVGEDLLLLAASAQVSASTTGDARIVAADTVISGTVGGDLVVVAGSVSLLSNAQVAGNVYAFGGQVTLDGAVVGSVYGAMERLTITGTIGGEVDVTVPVGLTVGPEATIAGSVTYKSQNQLQRAPTAVIEGVVTNTDQQPVADARSQLRDVLTPIFVLLFAALSLYLLFKRGLQSLVTHVDASPLIASGVGLATFFGGPIAGFLLLFTVLGFALGVLVIGTVVVLYTLALALAGVVLGAYVHRLIWGTLAVTPLTVLAGTVLLAVLAMVPVIGPLCASMAFVVTLGGLTRGLYHVLHTRAE